MDREGGEGETKGAQRGRREGDKGWTEREERVSERED